MDGAEIVRILLENGAVTTIKDATGETPEDAARYYAPGIFGPSASQFAE